jgi:hypothetical protein
MASLQKNVASQNVTFCLVNATTGAADPTGTGLTGFVTKDNGTQAATAGTFTNKTNGQYNYAPTQAETNATDVGFLFTATGDIPLNIDFHTDNVDAGGNLQIDVVKWNGTAVAAPATAGIPDVNVKNINNVSGASVTTVSANQGTTQPVNFTGTGGSALVQVDAKDWNGTPMVGTVPPDAMFLRNGTAQAGGATSITLDSGASAVNNFYNGADVFIRSGTGAGQTNVITGYVGSTKVATVGATWATTPDATSVFTVAAFGPGSASVSGTVNANVTQWSGTAVGTVSPDSILLRNGTAQGGAASSITLDAGASATTNLYNGATIFIRSGTGAGQTNVITAYNGGTKVATVGTAWATVPDATSVFSVAAFGPVQASVSGTVNANVISWSGVGVTGVSPDTYQMRNGTAQAGSANTITLDAGASAVSGYYNGQDVYIRSGTGAGQADVIISYNGATKVATLGNNWATNPDATSVFTVAAFGPVQSVVSGTVTANVTQWNGTNVSTPATAGIPDVNVKNINNISGAGVTTVNANQGTTQPVNFTGTAGSALVQVDTRDWLGSAVSAATAGIPDVNTKNINNISMAGVTAVGTTVGTTQPINFTGTGASALVQVDVKDWLASAVSAATAGIPDVNVKNLNNLSAGGVTTISGNVGTSQPINFTGTGASALVQVDTRDVSGTPVVSPMPTNMTQINGNATSAAQLALANATIVSGTCTGGSTTTAVVGTLVNPASLTTAGQLIGRTIIFLSNTTTGGLRAQASNITQSTTGATPTISFTAMTNAPANGDTFVVV